MGETIRIYTLIACITMLYLMTFSGCNSVPAGDMPTGWPIAELSFPDSAMIDLGEKGTRTTDSGEKLWTVGINNTMSWDKLNKHIASRLKPLGYSAFYSIKNGNDKRDTLRTYVSGDHLTEVVLWNLSAMGAPAGKPDCTVSVRLRVEPSESISKAGTTEDGTTYVLKPL